MTKTKEQIMLTEAFDKFDISLLQKCLDAGYDINAVDDFGDSYLSEALFSYGAKPCYLLENQDSKDEKKFYDIILSFDLEKISSLSAKEITEKKLDSVLINRGQFVYPKEWYKDSKSYQKKLISVFEVLLEKISIDQISNDILYECVYQQLPDLLEFLLEKGANPNVNCFNKYYAWVKSSAMYELKEDGSYFTKELYERFMNALVSHGAII